MNSAELQEQCELGQSQLMAMDYLTAEATLASAADYAWKSRDFDTLARVYLPLQEARRQRRQRAGEGVVCLDLVATDSRHQPDPEDIVTRFPQGQLLVAGWGNIRPALQVRRLAAERGLYLETFLGTVYPTDSGHVVVIVPLSDSIPDHSNTLPPFSLAFGGGELPRGVRSGTAQTYGQVMDLWERLHRPFLREADALKNPIQKIEAYLRAIQVDYACELAHQGIAQAARLVGKAPRVIPGS